MGENETKKYWIKGLKLNDTKTAMRVSCDSTGTQTWQDTNEIACNAEGLNFGFT